MVADRGGRARINAGTGAGRQDRRRGIALAHRRGRQGAVGSIARPGRGVRRRSGGARRAQVRDVERLVDFGRRRQAVARPGRRQEIGRWRRLADAPGARVGRAVIGEIEMDVVVVEHVRARTQDGGEILAGARVDLVQEGGFLGVGRLPVADERRSPGRRRA